MTNICCGSCTGLTQLLYATARAASANGDALTASQLTARAPALEDVAQSVGSRVSSLFKSARESNVDSTPLLQGHSIDPAAIEGASALTTDNEPRLYKIKKSLMDVVEKYKARRERYDPWLRSQRKYMETYEAEGLTTLSYGPRYDHHPQELSWKLAHELLAMKKDDYALYKVWLPGEDLSDLHRVSEEPVDVAQSLGMGDLLLWFNKKKYGLP